MYRACVITGPRSRGGEDLELQSRSLQHVVDSLRNTESVLVKIKAAGICHTDLHLWHGYYKIGKEDGSLLWFSDRPGLHLYPIVPGHEIAGVVHSLGDKAEAESQLMVGDRVVVYPWIGCDRCPHCSAGEHHLCPDSKDIGIGADGGYSEFVRVQHHQFVLKLPDMIPFVLGAMLPCGGITAYSALKKCSQAAARASKWQEGKVFVMVVGLGGVGRWALKLLPLTLRGFETHVTGVDIDLGKAWQAKEEGCLDDTFLLRRELSAQEQSQEYLKQSNHKPNVILDFVNSTDTFSFGTKVLARAGVRVMVGLHGGLGELQLPLAVVSESAHIGSIVGSLLDLREVLELVVQHGVTPPSVELYGLHDASRALRRLESGEVNGRAVLVMGDHDDCN